MEPPPPSVPPSKLRLMFSYGGRVTTRPHNPKTLTYLGGDTRIVTVDRSSTASSLPSLLSHLSAALSISSPFSLKYLLPNTELDSLISLVSDDDLALMLDELDRMSSSSSSSRQSRIRLFVFRDREDEVVEVEERGKVGSIRHPKTETWFSDALKGTRIGCGGDGGAESVILETSSSFGSTSSSVSYSSLPPVGCAMEETRGRFGMVNSYPRENSISSAVSSTQAGGGPYNEGAVHSTHLETEAPSGAYEVKQQVSYSGFEPGRTVQFPGYPLPPQFDQLHHVQYVPVGMPYGIENPSVAMTHQPPYYHPYHVQPPPPEQPLHFYYPPNQPCPVYMVPAVQASPLYGSSPAVDYGQPMIHPQVPPAQAPLVDTTQRLAKLQQPMLIEPQPQLRPEPLISVGENQNFEDHSEEDPARFQIYKSQPLPPPMPTQYQTMAEATTLMLTEALTQMNTGGDKQQS